MRSKLIDFEVEGRGDFPLDMLRYDGCWPADGHAVAQIERTYARDHERYGPLAATHPERRTIRLRMYSEHRIGPTVDRWRSFGWNVSEFDA